MLTMLMDDITLTQKLLSLVERCKASENSYLVLIGEEDGCIRYSKSNPRYKQKVELCEYEHLIQELCERLLCRAKEEAR